MTNCPRCGNKNTKVLNEWDYRAFHVKNFHCGQCEINFKAYYSNGKLSHIIDNCIKRLTKTEKRSKVIKYLKAYHWADENKIANALQLPVIDVSSILAELEDDDIVERVVKKKGQ